MEKNLDDIVNLMSKKKNIRNMSVIAHVDHGKSTLTDNLLIKALHVKKDSYGKRIMDVRPDEIQRGITIKSNAVACEFQVEKDVLDTYLDEEEKSDECSYLINLIDSPGHVDFSSEVTAALRITDGALVVVDVIDGVCVQTKSVLEQALRDRIVATVVLNKLDRAILEMNYPIDKVSRLLFDRVEAFNSELSEIGANVNSKLAHARSPVKGDFSFCSGLQGWGFTLLTVARKILQVFGKHTFEKEQKFAKILFSLGTYCENDSPFEPIKLAKIKDGVIPEGKLRPLELYCLQPLYIVHDLSKKLDIQGLVDYAAKFKVTLDPLELKTYENYKRLFGFVMKSIYPASDCLLEQIVLKLPSPAKSQVYRADYLYTGKIDDDAGQAIKLCKTGVDDPVMMYVSKMVPDGRGFVALGRVFSGVIKPGDKLYVQTPEYEPTGKKSPHRAFKTISRVAMSMGRGFRDISHASAGNIVALGGIESVLVKTGTVTSFDGAYNIRTMKFMVSPVVKVSVKPKDVGKLQAFKDGLEKLAKSDPMIVVDTTAEGGPTVACAGELHLEIILTDLKVFAGCDFIKGPPSIKYFETIGSASSQTQMAKSPNKHNRIYLTCEPLDEDILANMEQLVDSNSKEVAKKFKEVLGMDDDWIKKIMFFGPDVDPANILVDQTKGIQYMTEVKEHLREGFWNACKKGPMVNEPVKGIRYNLMDLTLHADSIHRGANQMISPMENVCKGLVLDCCPMLLEPIFLATFFIPLNFSESTLDRLITTRRGLKVIPDDYQPGTVYAQIPVAASFGLHNEVMALTGGTVRLILALDKYDICPGSLAKEGSEMAKAVAHVREIKKITTKLDADHYFDKL